MYIFRDFRLENCTKTAFYAILRHYLTKNVHRCAIRERLEVTVHYDGYCDFSRYEVKDSEKTRNLRQRLFCLCRTVVIDLCELFFLFYDREDDFETCAAVFFVIGIYGSFVFLGYR